MKPYEVNEGDVMDVLPTLEAESFDAMLTDPPYGLAFMGREWDEVVPGVDVWRECLRVLKPGALALVFGGTRTFHRLAVALEDAGFEIRDTLMWVYGSGFPKSHNLKGEWEGYGTALKPAWEPALLVRKPSPLTFAEGAVEYGTGALNIDGTRVPFTGEADEAESKNKNRHADFGSAPRDNKVFGFDPRDRAAGGNYDPPGRWPANLIHDGSDEVTDLFPPTHQAGNLWTAEPVRGGQSQVPNVSPAPTVVYRDGGGTAARFFYTAKADTSERDTGLEGRNPHPTVKPLALTEYLARLLLPPSRDTPRRILTPFAGSGSEMIGALQAGWDETVGIEREREYVEIARARLAHFSRGLQTRLLEAV